MKSVAHRKPSRAVVIGGSMAGLLAATALADTFDDVLLLERDPLVDDPAHRRGVPQSRHTHVILASGIRALESLFPGIMRELADAGAVGGDSAHDVSWFLEGARLRRFIGKLDGMGMSRALLERVVRARVRMLPNVRVRDNAAVDGLCASKNRGRVVGVRVGNDICAADLVVDATGRGSRSPHWLEELGYRAPREEKVGMELRYTSRLFRRRPQDLDGLNAVVLSPPPSLKRGGVIVRQERDTWIVTLGTHFGDFPPSELAGFVEFARGLPASDIYDVIRDAEPIGDPQTIRVPVSVRYRYETLRRFPRGYIVVGDAISSFNPIYGQGMSVAALEAVELLTLLRKSRRGLAQRFFRRAAKIVDAAWSVSCGNDLRMPETTGRRKFGVALINWYVAKLLVAGHHDPVPAHAFLKVSNLLEPPLSLLKPSIVWHVARAHAGRSKAGGGSIASRASFESITFEAAARGDRLHHNSKDG